MIATLTSVNLKDEVGVVETGLGFITIGKFISLQPVRASFWLLGMSLDRQDCSRHNRLSPSGAPLSLHVLSEIKRD